VLIKIKDMTKTRLKELQTEIARLQEIDNKTTERVNAEFERYSNTEQKVHHSQIHIPCSLEQDMEWANESI